MGTAPSAEAVIALRTRQESAGVLAALERCEFLMRLRESDRALVRGFYERAAEQLLVWALVAAADAGSFRDNWRAGYCARFSEPAARAEFFVSRSAHAARFIA